MNKPKKNNLFPFSDDPYRHYFELTKRKPTALLSRRRFNNKLPLYKHDNRYKSSFLLAIQLRTQLGPLCQARQHNTLSLYKLATWELIQTKKSSFFLFGDEHTQKNA